MTDEPIPHVLPPPDATQLFEWTTDQNGLFREFSGATQEVSGAQISISGYQNGDGSCHRWLTFHAIATTHLSPAQARELATALHSAADEIERLDHTTPPLASITPGAD